MMSALANHLWQSTAVLVAVWLLTLLLRQNSARLRHGLWLVASAKFLLPISLLIGLGARLEPVNPAASVSPNVSVLLQEITVPFAANRGAVAATRAATPDTAKTGDLGVRFEEQLPAYLLGLWALGFSGVLFSWQRQWRRVRALVQQATPVGSVESIRIRSSKSLLEPGVFGIVRPILVLPESIRDRLSEGQLNAVIAHEVTHVKRRDNAAAAFHMFVEAAFWFHPLVWWIGKRLMEERELACDEAVVRAGNEPGEYAQGILNVCKSYLETPVFCVSGVTGADLKKRVLRIMANQMSRQLDLGRKLILCVAGAMAVVTPVSFGLLHVVHAQGQDAATQNSPTNLAGSWQGTLNAGGHQLRIVLKVEKATDGWGAKMYSIDQTPQPIPVNTVTLQGSQVKFSVTRVFGNYEGTMSPDGSTITGTWTQAGPALPLVLKRATPDTEWTIGDAPPPPKPMAADAKLDFDVATVKPSKPGQQGMGITMRGHRFVTINTSLENLMTFAYHLNERQLSGFPSWASSERYDIEAQPSAEGAPNDTQIREMMKKLIAERFKVTTHQEKRELPVYTLTVAKSGPKLTPDKDNPNGLPGLLFRGLGDLVASNANMSNLAELLQGGVLDRPVVDETGLQGKYDFSLKWTPDATQFAGLGIKVPPPSTAADAPPDLFAAIQQQLGLKLEAGKAAVTVYVADHVQQPTAN